MGQDVTVSGISKIARCPASYAYGQAPFSVTLTSADLFCLDGQELTGTDWPYGTNGATYVTTPTGHMEEISYTSNSAEGPQWFKVLHPDGSVWEYGHTTDSEVMATNSSGQSVVRVWLLDQIEDASGNTITFHYTQPSGTGAYYLSSVDWGSNATKGTGADRSYVFTYQTMSSAATKHRYVAGHLIEWNREISKVAYQYNGTTELSWTPTYQTSNTGRSLLSSVQECAGSLCLPATAFSWQSGQSGFAAAENTGQAGGDGVILPKNNGVGK